MAAFFDSTGALGRIAIAALPFAIAIVSRLMLGANRFTGTLVFVTVVWLTLNVLMSPFSADIRQDYLILRGIFG